MDESESARAVAGRGNTDATIAGYEVTAARFRDLGMVLGPVLQRFLDRVAARVGVGARVLELGSGPGRDARYLESRGVRVQRSDATRAFVELLRGDGFDAMLLDVRTDHLGGPWDAVFANAVLLHLDRAAFADALAAIRRAVRPGGVLAFTLKDGDGEAWTNERLEVPRWFVFWRRGDVADALAAAGWIVESLDEVEGPNDPWLHVIARAPDHMA